MLLPTKVRIILEVYGNIMNIWVCRAMQKYLIWTLYLWFMLHTYLRHLKLKFTDLNAAQVNH